MQQVTLDRLQKQNKLLPRETLQKVLRQLKEVGDDQDGIDDGTGVVGASEAIR